MAVKNKKRILLVEDEFLLAQSQKNELENAGYSIITCCSGEKAIELVMDEEKIDLILMDINLGNGMNGTEAAMNINRLKDLPIVFLSCGDEAELTQISDNVKCYGCILKGSNMTMVNTSIQMAFRLHQSYQALNKQKEFEERIKDLALFPEENDNPVMRVSKHGYLLYFNEPAKKMFKNSISDLGQMISPTWFNILEQIWDGKKTLDFEISEEERIFHCYAKPIYDREYINIYVTDITEQNKSKTMLKNIFDLSEDLICIADINTCYFVKINPSFTKVLGYSEEELLAKPFFEFIHPQDINNTENIVVKDLQKGKIVYNFKNRYRCKNGGYRWLSWHSHPVVNEGITYAIGRDITEQMASEQKLKMAYEENTILLSELQHRVKNSFNLISGMLVLAKESKTDKSAISAIDEIDKRIKAVSEMYSLLYQNHNFQDINMDQYLHKLLSSLVIPENIIVQDKIDNFSLSMTKGIYLGLIVNELVTNAMKYAFPENENGTISIQVKNRDGNIISEISDNGVGFDHVEKSLGLELVENLTMSLKGHFHINGENGTKCMLEFPL